MNESDLPDDSTRPLAPRIEGATPEQRMHGRRLRLYHRIHLQELAGVRRAMEALVEGRTSGASLAESLDSTAIVQNYRQFGNLCGQQCQLLTLHHTIEDQHVFPALRDRTEGLRKVVDRLSAEHLVIHDLLLAFESAIKAVPHNPSLANFDLLMTTYARLEGFVMSHFGYEERELEEALGYYAVPL